MSLFLGLPLRLFTGKSGEPADADATSVVIDLNGVIKGPSDAALDGSPSGNDFVRSAPGASVGLSMTTSCCRDNLVLLRVPLDAFGDVSARVPGSSSLT